MKELIIQVGKSYQLRNGLITEPLRKNDPKRGNYIFEAKVKEPQHKTPSVMSWKGNGKALIDYIEHKHDIIKEI